MQAKSDFALSVSIPTRNRATYVYGVAQTLLASMPDCVEIVVSDNSDDINLSLQAVASINPRLQYRHTPEPLSFAANFNLAVSLCTGKYVTAIGDDDYVLPYIVEVLGVAERHGIQAVVYDFNAIYYWPGVRGRTAETGLLRVFCDGESPPAIIDQRQEVRTFLETGLCDYSKTKLARIYHGAVSRELVQKVRDAFGDLYGGLSPDIYSSILLANCADRVLHIGFPLTMPGISPKSGSGQSASGAHRGPLSSAPHFRGTHDYRWDESVPKFYSVQSIWGESAIKALRQTGATLIKFIDFNRFLANTLLENPQIVPLILRSVRKLQPSDRCRYKFVQVLGHLLAAVQMKALSKARRRKDNGKSLSTNNISEAANFAASLREAYATSLSRQLSALSGQPEVEDSPVAKLH